MLGFLYKGLGVGVGRWGWNQFPADTEGRLYCPLHLYCPEHIPL